MSEPDLSEFVGYSKPRFKPCPVKEAADTLPPADQSALKAALAEDQNRITNAGISAWFAARDLTVPWQNISSHRRGTCPCGKA